jgi:hippurate hydrolase
MGLIKKIQEMQHEMSRWRKKLHEEPELAFEERATARYLTRQLQSFGIETHSLARTGVIGVLHGRNGPGGKAIMLRADMDALPIQEATGAHHSSKTPGVHHACGHDGHMAMLLGAARHLAKNGDFDGTVYFVFQPAEEHIGGAKEMIKDGLFQKFPCEEVYGLHNYPGLPLGQMATGAGPLLAASDEFHVTFRGAGGHTSDFDKATNVIGAAAEAVTLLNALATAEIPAGEPALLAVSAFTTDTHAANVLPEQVRFQGSIRTYDPALHEKLKQEMERIVAEMAAKFGAEATVEFKNGYPALVNSATETGFAVDVAKDVVGDANVISSAPKTMGVEDFACYLQNKPGNYMAIGTGRADGKPVPELHSAKYDFNDAALPIGASYWVKLVEKALPAGGAPTAPKAAPPAPKL